MARKKNMYSTPKMEAGSQDLNNVFLPKLPSEQFSQVSNQSFGLGRQDSLSFCSRLQDADRDRTENIMDFMEREMNLDEYIGALRDLDVPPDHIDLDDMELQKSHLIYDDPQPQQQDQYDPFAHRVECVPQQNSGNAPQGEYEDQFSVYGSSDRSVCSTPVLNVKTEEDDEEGWEYGPSTSTSTVPPPRRRRDPQNDLQAYTPKTKARKYQLKADEEKKNPAYKLKRARNNDAVRKSRTKQKELQEQRDRELTDLRNDVIRLQAELDLQKQLNADQKITIQRLSTMAGPRR